MSKNHPHTPNRPTRSPKRGALLRVIGIACIIIAAAIFLVVNVLSPNMPWAMMLGGNIILALIATAGFSLLSRGQRLSAPAGEDTIAKDQRPPVVYLRSFSKDREDTIGSMSWLGIPGQTDEQVLTKVMGRIGPFIAIGRPGESLPALGAARLYVEEDKWRDKIQDLISRSALVVLRAGNTEGFWWEMERTIELISPERILLFLGPPINPKTPSIAEKEYIQFRNRANEYLPIQLPEGASDANFIAFSEHWEPRLISVAAPRYGHTLEARYSAALQPVLGKLGVDQIRTFSFIRVIYLLLICLGAWLGIVLLLFLIRA